jgi:FkbM family methyltransferase
MTPIIHIRSFTDDQYVLDKVFYSNFYRLKGFKEKRPIVVDVGAHCGYFTFASLALGADKIYSIEPFFENYSMLVKNCENTSNVILHQLGIDNTLKTISFNFPQPKKTHIEFNNIQPSFNSDKSKMTTCTAITLDSFLNNYVSESNIDILKINIGVGEINILQSSKLDNINSICGETYIEQENIPVFKSYMMSKGFIKSLIVPSQEQDNKVLFLFGKSDLEEYYNL